MLDKVTQYYKSLFFTTPDTNEHTTLDYPTDPAYIIGTGKIIYNLKRRGFYGIQTDEGIEYYITNLQIFVPQLRDRQRISFCIEPLVEVANIERWGNTARLIGLNIIT